MKTILLKCGKYQSKFQFREIINNFSRCSEDILVLFGERKLPARLNVLSTGAELEGTLRISRTEAP